MKIPSTLVNRSIDWMLGMAGGPRKTATLLEEVKRLNERLDSAVERLAFLEGRLQTFTEAMQMLDRSVEQRIRLQILEYENGKRL
jgi:hypothetical protein